MKVKVLNLIVALVLLTFATAFGQRGVGKEDGQIEDAEIIIEKNRKISLPEALKTTDQITNPVPPLQAQPQKYSYLNFKLRLPDIDSKIKVLTMKPDPLEKLYNSWVSAGIGNYGTTYLEGYTGSKREDKLAYGLHAKHFSNASGPVTTDNALSGRSNNVIDGFSEYYYTSYKIRGSAFYQRERYNFFGLADSAALGNRDARKQVFNTFGFKIDFSNTKDTSNSNYNGCIGLTSFADAFTAKETEFYGQFNYQYQLDKTSKLSVATSFSLAKLTDTLYTKQRNFLEVRPAYTYQLNKIKLKVGANVTAESDSFSNTSRVHLYPDLRLDYDLKQNKTTAYIGLDGKMQRGLLRTFVAQNPFLNRNAAIGNTNNLLHIYSGLKGNLSEKLAYHAEIGFSTFKNLALFVSDPVEANKYLIVYDNKSATLLQVTAGSNYSVNKGLNVGGSITYNNYNVETQKKAWLIPALKLNAYGTLKVKEKILITASGTYYGDIYAKDPTDGSAKALKGIPVLDLKVDYLFNSRFSAFVSLSNLLNQKQPQLLYYNTRGLMAIVGVTAIF